MLMEEIIEDDIPTEVSSSYLELIPGLRIKVVVLDNGKRVIPAEDWDKFCEYMNNLEKC